MASLVRVPYNYGRFSQGLQNERFSELWKGVDSPKIIYIFELGIYVLGPRLVVPRDSYILLWGFPLFISFPSLF